MEYLVETVEPSQNTSETVDALTNARHRREPGFYDDLMMTVVPFLVMCVIGAGALWVLALGAKAMDEQWNSRPAVLPAQFDHEFYNWCVTELKASDNYCYWHSGG